MRWGGGEGPRGEHTPAACVRVFQNRGQYLGTLHGSCTYEFLLKFHFNLRGVKSEDTFLFFTDPRTKIRSDFSSS